MTLFTPPPTPPSPQPPVPGPSGAGRALPARRRKPRKGPALVLALLGVLTMGFNERGIRVVGPSLSDMLFVATAGVVIIQLLSDHSRGLAPARMRRSSRLILVGSIVMLSAGTLTSLWSFDPATSMSVVLRYAWLTVAWFWILRSVVPDRDALTAVLRWLRAGLLISSAAAVLGYLGVIHDATNLSGRQSAFFSHANGLAGYLAMGVPFFILGVPSAWSGRSSSVVRNHLLPTGLVLLALATTGSITAALAAVAEAVTIGVLLLLKGRQRRRRQRKPLRDLLVIMAVAIALVALAQSGTQLVERFTAYTEGGTNVRTSANFRERGASFVIGRFDENLVLGVGFDRESAGSELTVGDESYGAGGSGIHNMTFKLYYEGGAFTLLGLVLILVGTLQMGRRVVRATAGDDLQNLAIALLASVVGLNVLAQFQPMGFERFYWFPVALTGALWAVRRRELEERPTVESASV